MNYDEFVGRVQNDARLASNGEAVRAIRATLTTLGERLFGGEANDLAAQLPDEIAHYLREPEDRGSFPLDEFYERISIREGTDLPVAIHHAQVVMAVLNEAITGGGMEDMRAQLPAGYNRLFELEDKGE